MDHRFAWWLQSYSSTGGLLLTTMIWRVIVTPVDPPCKTVNELGFTVRVGTVSTVRFTGTTTGLFDAGEVIVTEPV